jgi:hypothetical protein
MRRPLPLLVAALLVLPAAPAAAEPEADPAGPSLLGTLGVAYLEGVSARRARRHRPGGRGRRGRRVAARTLPPEETSRTGPTRTARRPTTPRRATTPKAKRARTPKGASPASRRSEDGVDEEQDGLDEEQDGDDLEEQDGDEPRRGARRSTPPSRTTTSSKTPEAGHVTHGTIVSTVARCAPRGIALRGLADGLRNHGAYVRAAAHGAELTVGDETYDLGTLEGAVALCASFDDTGRGGGSRADRGSGGGDGRGTVDGADDDAEPTEEDESVRDRLGGAHPRDPWSQR